MTYTETLRSILLHSDLKKKCCRVTELFIYTCMLTGKCSAGEALASCGEGFITVKNPDLFSRIRFIASKLLPGDQTSALKDAGEGENFGFRPASFGGILKETLAWNTSELDAALKNDCCRAAALRAFFCVAGTVSSPDKPKCYVELYFGTEEEARCCGRILDSFSIRAGVSLRRNKYVCYIKSAEGVSDFLTVTGAPSESIKFQVAKTRREVNNNVNRVMNCDMANIEKIRRCCERELKAANRLRETGLLYSLPEDLRDLVQFRIANPVASHSELGALMNPRISGSTVSRKMKQIVETAESGK